MKNLYDNLKALADSDNEAFYMVEQEFEGLTYEVFTYRMASYTDFQLPGALECRGHTFQDGQLVSLPMQKFFNLGENPFTMGLDLSQVCNIANKLDGSLISTVRLPEGRTLSTLKSKTSFSSPQAIAANELLQTDEYAELWNFCEKCAERNCTVNMEYCGPDNRIVLGYAKPMLRVLNVRRLTDGSYLSQDLILEYISKNWLAPSCKGSDITGTIADWVERVYEMQGIEGYVCTMSDGRMFKLKTNEYAALHRTKDSITIPRRLWEVCITGGSDDLRQMFKTDPTAVQMIDDMEAKAFPIYNDLIARVEKYHNENQHLDRKSYAIKGQEEFPKKGEFGAVMQVYSGREVDYKAFLCKNWKLYGISDKEIVTDE